MANTDREKVELLAKKLKEDEALKIQANRKDWEQSKKHNADTADKTELRLSSFKKSLEIKLGVRIKRKDNRFFITYGSSPILSKPRRAFEIACNGSFYSVNYSIPLDGVKSTDGLFSSVEKHFTFKSLDSLIEHMTVQAAQSINMETDDPPAWAEWSGLIGAVACWLLASSLLGPLGAFFGLIPALIIYYIIKNLWPVLFIVIILLVWLAIK